VTPIDKKLVLAVVVLAAVAALGAAGIVMARLKRGGIEAVDARGQTKVPRGGIVSIARLSGPGKPDNCADVTFPAGKVIDYDRLRTRGFVVLKGMCAQAFPGAVALASCARHFDDNPAEPPATGVSRYYELATLGADDTYRGQCLGTGGSWTVDAQFAAMRARMPATTTPRHDIDSLIELMP